ncbi:DUF61 family protein [Methanohalophilus portucalensis]|uniref:DUF61 family protein n=2 Tax=Methanohalophilus portucalensis TaxID=39664 RepID=A0A1L9C225_9EURY|nr:DUF61 family protein [Methanohalophilus portucalensis]ATU07405.1 hypothetical protein BKM01_00590 [Methanohalophilus portucalensis]OJH48543.1 hypothetical protein MPF_1845 [Methanohalophilus portucalensis FDF-1]RNI09447.1 DUF61 family protein [Methanohalophilus portucalensis FDF-1]SMH39536.1 hypothetical protein SAMN06264941_1401 [Methanohalophilus portucalensis FDF-1]
MTGRLPDSDNPVFARWMKGEMGKINRAIVAQRKTLAQLLEEEVPHSRTRAGDRYVFDKEVIGMLGEEMPSELHDRLKLPILFFFDFRVEDSCFLNDRHALRALQNLSELGEMYRMRQGKVWVGKSMAYSIMHKYPTAIQITMG